MTELLTENRYADIGRGNQKWVRTYRDTPDTILLQIFTETKNQYRVTSCCFTFEQAQKLASHLMAFANFD